MVKSEIIRKKGLILNQKLVIGEKNRLEIFRQTDNGFYLRAQDENEVLLPNQYITPSMKIGGEVDVFLYHDSEDRIVAVTTFPQAIVGEFGYFEVVDVAHFGAFVDWGLPKDLFVPKSMQKIPFKVGMKTVLRVCKDDDTDRVVGNHKYTQYINKDTQNLSKNQEVKFIVYKETELGFKVIVENQYDGLIFHSEVFGPLRTGDKKSGYIKLIREDGKLDIALRPTGEANENLASQKVMEVLTANNGKMKYHYKSTPEEINLMFGLSRKIFKKALTSLSESGKITVDENGIALK